MKHFLWKVVCITFISTVAGCASDQNYIELSGEKSIGKNKLSDELMSKFNKTIFEVLIKKRVAGE